MQTAITKNKLRNFGFEEDPVNCWHINEDEFKMFYEETDGSYIQYEDTLDNDIGEPFYFVEQLIDRYKSYTGKELKYRESDEPPTV